MPASPAAPPADRVNDLFFAEAGTYEQLHAAMRARAENLNVSRASLDCEMGLADGYAGKMLAPKPIKGVITRTALEPILKALRLKLIIVDDPEVVAMRGDLPQRDIKNVRLNNDCRKNKGRRTPKTSSYVPRTVVRCG